MIRVKPATEEDVREAAAKAKEVYTDDTLECCLSGLKNGRAFALYNGSGTLGCVVGFVLIARGVASCWAITTPEIATDPMWFTRMVKKILEDGAKMYVCHRAEITVRADYFEGIRWAKALGFEAEGYLRQYGSDKSDHLIFGRIWA